MIDGQQAGHSTQFGVDLNSGPQAKVRAGNDGIVIFSDNLGVYGKTVILDHGLGLTTLYGYLSTTSVSEGDRVNRGNVIGVTGETGLAETDSLHFEVRLHGIPVQPLEWWDDQWIAEQIDGRILSAKKTLGLRTSRPLK
jgi:murein DD-endopeptidase MepM/ murein hydrolase activator NlpD